MFLDEMSTLAWMSVTCAGGDGGDGGVTTSVGRGSGMSTTGASGGGGSGEAFGGARFLTGGGGVSCGGGGGGGGGGGNGRNQEHHQGCQMECDYKGDTGDAGPAQTRLFLAVIPVVENQLFRHAPRAH